ncbi:MAG: PorT family protein [Muribaculaceae bacterium]|nr:PorT family protein [Muribaculaceae bacterium]
MNIRKFILSLTLLFGMLSVNAQDWRGFLEIYAGTSPTTSDLKFQDDTFYDMWNSLSFGLNYTMGVAVIPQLYAGIGIGGYTTFIAYHDDPIYNYWDSTFSWLNFPIFANIRWIPDINKKINPFVDLKIGYQIGVDLDENRLWTESYDKNVKYYVQRRNGLFLQPGVGIRFGRDSAFNLGIAYSVCVPQEFVAKDRTQQSMPVVESIKKNFGSFMLTFGVDF